MDPMFEKTTFCQVPVTLLLKTMAQLFRLVTLCGGIPCVMDCRKNMANSFEGGRGTAMAIKHKAEELSSLSSVCTPEERRSLIPRSGYGWSDETL